MAKTTADVLFERLIDWGVDVDLRPARRRHQRVHRGVADAPGQDPVHPGAARGGGRVRGVRLRQVLRTARRLHRHLGSRGDPPPEWPL